MHNYYFNIISIEQKHEFMHAIVTFGLDVKKCKILSSDGIVNTLASHTNTDKANHSMLD
jgi:hypothetical protein